MAVPLEQEAVAKARLHNVWRIICYREHREPIYISKDLAFPIHLEICYQLQSNLQNESNEPICA